jgi:hypothetical protein
VLLREEIGRIVCTALAVALLTGLSLGCGGSSEAAPLGRAQFIKQGDAICATAQAARGDQREELSGQDSDSEVVGILLEPIEQMTEELAGLGAPVGEEKQVDAIVSAYEEGAAKLEADPGGPDSVTAFDKANELAEDYGLTGCAI